MGNFVPWREPAWALLRERMAFLAEKCTNDPAVVRAAGEMAASLADKLAAPANWARLTFGHGRNTPRGYILRLMTTRRHRTHITRIPATAPVGQA